MIRQDMLGYFRIRYDTSGYAWILLGHFYDTSEYAWRPQDTLVYESCLGT